MFGGQSQKDRIMFYSNNNTATAIRNKNGTISFEYGKPETTSGINFKSYVLLSIPFIGPLLLKNLLIYLIDNKTIVSICYLIPFLFYSIMTLVAIIQVRKEGGIEYLRNHGAEHKVVAAYLKLRRAPTIQEANSFSRISNHCGTTLFSCFITPQLIGFIVYVLTGYIILEPLLLLITVLLAILPIDFLGKLLQLFTTSKPKQCNIELAIAALIALNEKELSDDYIR